MKFPGVGVAAIITKNRKVLMAKRKNVHGAGFWQFPGGKLELNEGLHACVRREVMEEAGIKVSGIRLVGLTNDIFLKDRKHYITVFYACRYSSGRVRLMEPEKNGPWAWFEWKRLPKPLFFPIRNLLKQGFDPFA